MSYRVLFTTRAAKQFGKLPGAAQEALRSRIEALSSNPRPTGHVKIAGAKDEYRIRAGDYRVIYSVQDHALIVLVIAAGHRREVYR